MKYIRNSIIGLKNRIAGMKANPELWTNQSIKADMEKYEAELEEQSAKVDSAENALKVERANARKLVKAYELKKKQFDSIVVGIHLNEPLKQKEYGLKLRKKNTSRPVPAKAIIISIVDDNDGEGFIINWKRLVGVTHYEIQRGVAANSTDVAIIPAFLFLKSTTRITFTDNDVEKGVRYFYRIRGVNASGNGEWSEAVNKVQ